MKKLAKLTRQLILHIYTKLPNGKSTSDTMFRFVLLWSCNWPSCWLTIGFSKSMSLFFIPDPVWKPQGFFFSNIKVGVCCRNGADVLSSIVYTNECAHVPVVLCMCASDLVDIVFLVNLVPPAGLRLSSSLSAPTRVTLTTNHLHRLRGK